MVILKLVLDNALAAGGGASLLHLSPKIGVGREAVSTTHGK